MGTGASFRQDFSVIKRFFRSSLVRVQLPLPFAEHSLGMLARDMFLVIQRRKIHVDLRIPPNDDPRLGEVGLQLFCETLLHRV